MNEMINELQGDEQHPAATSHKNPKNNEENIQSNDKVSIEGKRDSSEINKEKTLGVGNWTEKEHELFLEAMTKFGNDWTKVCKYIGTRTPSQARSHAQKFYNKKRKIAVEKTKADAKGKKLLFAVTREYVNRTNIKSGVELLDVPSRVPNKRKNEDIEDNKIDVSQEISLNSNKCENKKDAQGIQNQTSYLQVIYGRVS